MQVNNSPVNILFNFSDEGFNRVNFHFPEKSALDVYKGIDVVHDLVKNKNESLSYVDNCLEEYYLRHKDRLSSGASLTLKSIIFEKEGYHFISHQYLDGAYEYLEQNISLRAVNSQVILFLKAMKDAHLYIKTAIADFIKAIENSVQCFTILKVWKYPRNNEKPCVLPLHYDTSLFTIIVHTLNSGKECLRIGGYGDGKIIEELKKTVNLDEYYKPMPSDFPILFPGVFAKHYFNINPTAHAVTTSEIDFTSQSRYSLVFCIIPYDSRRLGINEVRYSLS